MASFAKPDVSRPVVLFLRSSLCELSCREFDGILRYANTAGWMVQVVEFGAAAENSQMIHGTKSLDIRGLLEFWKPIGCIVECNGKAPVFRCSRFGKVPVVFLDSCPSLVGKEAFCITSDSRAIAAIAARELLSLGFQDYAYLPFPEERRWSRDRGDAFSQIVRMNGKRFHEFSACDGRASGRFLSSVSQSYRCRLAQWCHKLPKPCGVFAANDQQAANLVSICLHEGIAVPGQLAVVGVDDMEYVCENSGVSISSVRTDNGNGGYLAAELLSDCIARRDCPHVRMFGCSGLTRRLSSNLNAMQDIRVSKMLDFIRRKACEGIRPADVATALGCSRRLADMRFRAAMGHTILDEIHEVRLLRAKSLLKNPKQDIAALPYDCGYASVADMCRVFRRRTGLTMSQFRRRQG